MRHKLKSTRFKTESVNKLFLYILVLLIYLSRADAYRNQEQIWFEIIYPSEIAYLYKIMPAKDYGGVLSHPLKKTPMVHAIPFHACTKSIENGRQIEGSVVLAERGSCSFVTKALNLDRYNPSTIIIANNNPDDIDEWIDMAADGTGRESSIQAPVFYMLGKDGHKIKIELTSGKKQNIAVVNIPINVTSHYKTTRTQPPWDFWY